jgi:hypothetical protein
VLHDNYSAVRHEKSFINENNSKDLLPRAITNVDLQILDCDLLSTVKNQIN